MFFQKKSHEGEKNHKNGSEVKIGDTSGEQKDKRIHNKDTYPQHHVHRQIPGKQRPVDLFPWEI